MTLRYFVAVLSVLIVTGCNSKETPPAGPGANGSSNPAATPSSTAAPPGNAVKSKVDVCGLLTSDDLKGVQGEAYKDAQRSDRQDGDFIVAQCYYALPTTANSVVLNVTTVKEGAGASSPRQFWEQTFGKEEAGKEREPDRQREKERAQKSKADKPGAEAEEEAPKPEKISALGDEAFWLASRVGGALYVLKGDQFFRISVGGAGDAKAKLNKSKTLAQRVLKKL